MKKFFFSMLTLLYLFSVTCFAQENVYRILSSGDSIVTFKVFNTKTEKIETSRSKEVIMELVKASGDVDIVLNKTLIDNMGYEHSFYQQYYKNIEVENGIFISHSKNGYLTSVNGDFINIGEVDVNAKITESEALDLALKAIGAEKYKWQIDEEKPLIKDNNSKNYYPKGETMLVYSDSLQQYRLSIRLNIYAYSPFSINYVFVDAITGDIIKIQNLTKNTQTIGTAVTKYSDTVNITTEYSGGKYSLSILTDSVNIYTVNLNNSEDFDDAEPFEDNDNFWNDYSFSNYVANDVHWAAEKVFLYWENVLGIHGWDGSHGDMYNYIHFGTDYENASWQREEQCTYYGDGYTTYKPFTAIDIVAHEWGHALGDGVNIMRESSIEIMDEGVEAYAICEGMSDIWGACVEQWAAPTKEYWKNGEQIMNNGFSCGRSLQSPNTEGYRQGYSTEGNYPDTYHGYYWYYGSNENVFAHVNSTVISHWFYLLSEGGVGTNDYSNPYNVSGLGITNAAKIAWYAELYYFDHNTTFSEARSQTIAAAAALFGANSCQVVNVTNAWYAVGVGNSYSMISGSTLVCSSPNKTYNLNGYPSGATITWTNSDNLEYVSGQGTSSYIVKAKSGSTYYGPAWVKVTTTSGSCTTTETKDIWAGAPVCTPSGPEEGYIYNSYLFYANAGTLSEPTSYNWVLNPVLDNHLYSYGSYADISFYSEYPGYQVLARATNTCGTGEYGVTNISISDGSKGSLEIDKGKEGYSLYPNPASRSITITIINNSDADLKSLDSKLDKEEPSTFYIRVIDMSGVEHFKTIGSGDTYTFPVNKLKNGRYIVIIDTGNKISKLPLVINNH
jgi:Zn-dependent metalloprotease